MQFLPETNTANIKLLINLFSPVGVCTEKSEKDENKGMNEPSINDNVNMLVILRLFH